MKKAIILIFLLVTCHAALAQDKHNQFTFNPIKVIRFSMFNVQYERAFADKKTGLAFSYSQTPSRGMPSYDFTAFSKIFDVSLKKYNNKFSKSGFWYGGQVSLALSDLQAPDHTPAAEDISALSLVMKEGYQLAAAPFIISVHLGLGVQVTSNLFGKAKFYDNYQERMRTLLSFGIQAGFLL